MPPPDDVRRDADAIIGDDSNATMSLGGGGAGEALTPLAGPRYVLLDTVGEGRSAVVYTAYDRKLGRKVALKLLRSAAGLSAQTRILREAQSLARLRHPNVVLVYDAGTYEGRVFLTMELVEGTSLRGWLAAERRGWREVLAVFVAAGRGLVAAHAEGLVHRDFKPDNVLIGLDGTVRVADFGLAKLAGERLAGDEEPSFDSSPLMADLTHTGGIVGTPRYMPPEQHVGGPIDARADQFAFCVALYEALYAQPPFTGADREELHANVAAGRLARTPRGSRVPVRVELLVRRGLDPVPEARHPSLEVLLAGLAHDPARRRRHVLLGVGLAVLATAGAVALRQRPDVAAPCARAPERLAGVWDGPTRDALTRAFTATGRAYAADVARRVTAHLDGYATAWVDMRAEACAATAVRHEQSEALLDLRMGCLDRRLQQLGSLTALLGKTSDEAVVNGAIFAVEGLEDLAACADPVGLTTAMAPPGVATRAAVTSLRARIDAARALLLAGKFTPGLAAARALADEARGIDYPPVVVEAIYLLSQLQGSSRDADGARATLLEALPVAALAKDDTTSALIWVDLVRNVSQTSRAVDALTFRPMAEAALLRAGAPPARWARLLLSVGIAQRTLADHAASKASLNEAVALLEPTRASDWIVLGGVYGALGLTLKGSGDYAGARVAQAKSLALYENGLGAEHPFVAGSTMNLAVLDLVEGDSASSRERMERALAIRERAEGSDGADVALASNNLGELARTEGRFEDARHLIERALAIREKRLGPDHPTVGLTLRNLGATHLVERHYAAAAGAFERALAIARKARAADHPEVSNALVSLAEVELRRGEPKVALAHIEEALAVLLAGDRGDSVDVADGLSVRAEILAALGRLEDAARDDARALAVREKVGRDTDRVASSLTALAERQVALGRAAEALPLLERALVIREARHGFPTDGARTRFALAQALWSGRRDDPRALRLAGEAQRAFAAGGAPFTPERGDVERWLAARR